MTEQPTTEQPGPDEAVQLVADIVASLYGVVTVESIGETILRELAAAGRLLPEGASREPFKTWYRSLTPGGQLWCESSDPDELARWSAGTGCTFERLEIVTVTLPWQPWVPPDPIDEESTDG